VKVIGPDLSEYLKEGDLNLNPTNQSFVQIRHGMQKAGSRLEKL
jgi:hypothetical protein